MNSDKIIVEMLLDITNRLEIIEDKLNTIEKWTVYDDDLSEMDEEVDITFSTEALTKLMSDIFETDNFPEQNSKNVIKFPEH